MGTDQVNVTFECKNCGGTVLELPDDPTDDSIVVCKACRTEFGTWGDVQAKARETVVEKIRSDFREALKGSKGWKIK